MREIDIAKARLACHRAMARPVYLQHWTYLVTVGMAESCQKQKLTDAGVTYFMIEPIMCRGWEALVIVSCRAGEIKA